MKLYRRNHGKELVKEYDDTWITEREKIGYTMYTFIKEKGSTYYI